MIDPANSQLLADRVILVTGAARGIGAATALAFAEQAATLILLDKNRTALERLYDHIVAEGLPEPALFPVDFKGASVTDYQQLQTSISETFGRLDGLVHCAASLGQLAPTQHQDPALWAETLHINLTAPVLLTRACLPLLESSTQARIIFSGDDHHDHAYWGAYGIAKGGLLSFAAQLAAEYAHSQRVQIHTIVPGPSQTQLYANAYPAKSLADYPTAEAIAQRYLTAITT